jgi:hypothetical membrane protein
MLQHKYARIALALCMLAAVFYNSWPLGYVLNNYTAHNGLMSDLEQAGQPYYWLFILGDVLAGICVVAASIAIWLKIRQGLQGSAWAACSLGLLLFGLFTIAATMTPAHCSVSAALACGTSSNHGLGVDALFSVIAALGLLASLASACLLGMRYGLSWWLIRTTQGTLIAWLALGILFSVFALSSGKAAAAQLTQLLFLIAYGLALALIGLNVSGALRRGPALHKVPVAKT